MTNIKFEITAQLVAIVFPALIQTMVLLKLKLLTLLEL
jgi:hypothetical protein